jgi:hypothetical protein
MLNIGTLILINLLTCQYLFSQQSVAKNDVREELYIRTDREIYINGEEVWIKVYKLNSLTHTPWDISKVVYLELLDKNNFPLKQLKVETDGYSGSASFILPDNISSANYVIRAYTNWMKNYKPDLFSYKEISVINPFETIDHLKLPSDTVLSETAKSVPAAIPQASAVSGERNNPAGSLGNTEVIGQFNYSIKLEKTDYSSREKVKIIITATDNSGNPVETDLSVSVAKSALVKSSVMPARVTPGVKGTEENRDLSPAYLPEFEGHLISGIVRLKATDEPLGKTDISLSFVGKTARCQFSRTDDNGMFYFLLKEPGMSEIVIQPLSPEITGYYVELNQPFSGVYNNYKPSVFYLDSSKIRQVNNAVISMQVSNIYEPFRKDSGGIVKKNIPDFYGKPENTILMSDYIELTSLREVVKEIIPNVYTLKQNGKYDFKLINKFRGQPFENKPLILVDGVPIYDFEKVLSVNSKEIERADVINTRYFYAENVFDGIVSFITKKGNLSAMEFDNTIFRQVYEACQIPGRFYSPDYTDDQLRESHIPDFRNTLYWNPSLHTSKDGKTEAEFFTSDESADYMIIVEGLSSGGKTGFSAVPIVVK